MTEPLDRDDVIRLLDRLGSEDEAEVLEAARALHTQINEAGYDWDDLLARSIDDDADGTDAAEAADGGGPDADGAAPVSAGNGEDAATLALIEKLLAKPDRSDSLREELEEYKADIANGEFEARDHQYVRALYERLTK